MSTLFFIMRSTGTWWTVSKPSAARSDAVGRCYPGVVKPARGACRRLGGPKLREGTSVNRPRRQHISQVRGAVHDPLVRRIVPHVIVVHDEAGVQPGVLVRLEQPDPPQMRVPRT